MKNYSLCKIVWKHISCWEKIGGWSRFFSNNHYMDHKPILLVLSIMHKTGILHDTLNNVLAKLVCRTFIIIHDTYSRQNCILQSVELLSACGFLNYDSTFKAKNSFCLIGHESGNYSITYITVNFQYNI